ncbi:hypothetical protein ACHQM5_012895 [Ranunculus cassubicifolius]
MQVTRLQEQLQGERDLRSALEVGVGLPSGKLPDSRGMTSKTRAELEEIALAEADVARLKQKVTQHYGSLSDASNNHQHAQNLHAQLKFLQQDFDMNLAFCNQDRKQRTGVIEENQIHLSSSTLVDLTRRLDFFKERRSELIQQLDNLNLGYASSSFPPWS